MVALYVLSPAVEYESDGATAAINYKDFRPCMVTKVPSISVTNYSTQMVNTLFGIGVIVVIVLK